MFGSVTANELLIDKGKPEIDKGKPNKCLKKTIEIGVAIIRKTIQKPEFGKASCETQKHRPEVFYMGGVTLKKYFIKKSLRHKCFPVNLRDF